MLGVGDLNTVPAGLPHRLVEAGAPVRDVWKVLHPDSALGPVDEPAEHARRRPIPTAAYNLSENGATSDNVLNTWRWPPHHRKKPREHDVPADAIDGRGKRLDYIFASPGDVAALGGGWVVKSARVGMVDRHPDLGCSLSDHYSVEATLVFHATKPPPPATTQAAAAQPRGNDPVANGSYLLESPTPSLHRPDLAPDAQLAAFTDPAASQDFLPGATYDEILAAVHRYVARERTQRRDRAAHFVAWVVVAVACYIAVWFSPRNFVAFLLMLLCSLGLVAGTIDGLIALLFVGSEMRALKEFEWEVMNAKAAASGGPLVVEEAGDKGW